MVEIGQKTVEVGSKYSPEITKIWSENQKYVPKWAITEIYVNRQTFLEIEYLGG